MQPEALLREGRLADALAALQDQVRKDPSSARLRVFLFQLLSVRGEWERALNQLNVAGELDASTLPMVQTYREALACEALRAEVFAGKRSPVVFGTPAQWTAELIEALRLSAVGEIEASQQLRARAFDAAPAASGSVNGERFSWIADADPRIGPMVEAVVNGRYCWIPFSNIHSIKVDAPEDLRDMVWIPAEFVWSNEGQAVGLLPVRYPGSERSSDDLLRLSRRTDWAEQGGDLFFGLGQRLISTDAGEYPLLDVREILLDPSDG